MKSKFEVFLEKLNLEDNLQSSIKDGYNLLFEVSSTGSSSGYNMVGRADPTGSITYTPDPSGYNGGHATVFNEEEEFDGNEGADDPFEFKLPGLVGQAESDVQDIKDRFKSFLTKLHGMGDQGDKKNLTESIMTAINTLH